MPMLASPPCGARSVAPRAPFGSSMKPVAKAHLKIHVCVLLWGFTPILGKLITLSAPALVIWRMSLVVGALSLLPRVWRGWRGISGRLLLSYGITGCIVSIHWLTFYAAIKLANASVAATCLALAPVFLALVEPFVEHRRFDPRELLVGAGVVPGVALVVGGTPVDMRFGFVSGTISACLAAVFNVCNKRLAGRADPLTVTQIELGAGAVLLLLLAPWLPHTGALLPIPGHRDALWLVLLAGACTLVPFTLALMALEHLSAFSAQLAVNLEPAYAIVLAIVLLGEQHQLGASFYVGVAIIVAAVVAQPLMGRRAIAAA
jgi:drug/metabolite transporter (DMT)-like permease